MEVNNNFVALELPGITERIRTRWAAVQKAEPTLSRAKFAERHHLRQQSFNDWLNGVQPSLDGLKRLAGAFEVSWQWLLLGDDAAGTRPSVTTEARAEDSDVEQLAAHAREQFANVLARLDDGNRTQIVKHLTDQITLLAKLAAALAPTHTSAVPAPDRSAARASDAKESRRPIRRASAGGR